MKVPRMGSHHCPTRYKPPSIQMTRWVLRQLRRSQCRRDNRQLSGVPSALPANQLTGSGSLLGPRRSAAGTSRSPRRIPRVRWRPIPSRCPVRTTDRHDFRRNCSASICRRCGACEELENLTNCLAHSHREMGCYGIVMPNASAGAPPFLLALPFESIQWYSRQPRHRPPPPSYHATLRGDRR